MSKQASAQLVIKGNSGRKQEVSVPIKAENKSYRSEAAEVVLENPEPIYNFEFRCGDTFRTWQITGIGWDNFCMLFNSRSELVENGQLPEDGAYIIAPLGSSVEPVGAAQERLHGYWADYGYWHVDLKNTDVVLIKTEKMLPYSNASTAPANVYIQKYTDRNNCWRSYYLPGSIAEFIVFCHTSRRNGLLWCAVGECRRGRV